VKTGCQVKIVTLKLPIDRILSKEIPLSRQIMTTKITPDQILEELEKEERMDKILKTSD
jgi:ribosome assembly protein YihI (activator of Der GTPase)